MPPSRAHLGGFGNVFSPSSRVRRSWPASRHVSPSCPPSAGLPPSGPPTVAHPCLPARSNDLPRTARWGQFRIPGDVSHKIYIGVTRPAVGGVNTARCAPKRPSARAGTALPHGLAAMRRACPRPPHRCSGTYTARRRAGVAPVALSGIGPPARRSTRRASLRLRRAGRLAGTAWTRARYSRAGVGSAASGTGKRRSATARARAWPPRRS